MYCTKSDMFAGFVYVDSNRVQSTNLVYVCVGKSLIDDRYVMMELRLSEYVTANTGLLIKMKRGMAYEKAWMVPLDERLIRFFCRVGRLFDIDNVNQWLAQLKLSGVAWSQQSDMTPFYVGNWRNREKLAIVKEPLEWHFYLEEPVAYAYKRNDNKLKVYSMLWYYCGLDENNPDYHIWYAVEAQWLKAFAASLKSVSVSQLKQGQLPLNAHKSKWHRVKRQYKNMVEFNKDEWDLPAQ